MDNPRLVSQRPALPPRLAGNWDLWVPGGVWYSEDGIRRYRNYTPGAAINRLTIMADGAFVWAATRGTLAEVEPWFAQPGERYFAVRMDANNRYMLRYDARKDKVDLFFWGVGGHAASGTRR